MMKQLAGVAVALALVLSSTVSAKAFMWSWPSDDVTIENEDIYVSTHTTAESKTGGNEQWSLAKYGGDVTQELTTGVALSDAFAQISVASTFMPGCGCVDGDVEVSNEDIDVHTYTDALSKTGGNDQWGLAKGWGSDVMEKMTTGNAGSTAKSMVMVAYTDFSVESE